MSTPKISAIMSVYNGEEYLSPAIESVIGQTFTDWELIIINDCSTDTTADILASFAKKDSRIKVHTNEVNLRLPKSLNKAISYAKGKYIARMDADDICLPDRFEKQYVFMEKNGDVALSSCRFMTLKKEGIASGGCGGRVDSEALCARLLFTNPILHPGIIAKAEIMKELKYDETLTCTEDLELWTRFAMNGYKIEIFPEYLMLYRIHDKQITATTIARQHDEVLKIQKKYFSHFLCDMDEKYAEFYIDGIYFTNNRDVEKYREFLKWVRKSNKKFSKGAINYAIFEVLAEYKRKGIAKKDLLSALLCFNPFFLIKEFLRKKKQAKDDGKNCIAAAESIGLKKIGGTDEFPKFS
ncbi:MAG: glycosyltransferase family 2 protein [Clostridia bacterium]|nr:glycosyltransferase family 2 protein [Clostridia bacterium]